MSENGLPEGWESAQLGDLISPRADRRQPQRHGNLPFVGMDSVEAHTMRILDTVPAATMKSSAAYFKAGDVLYGRLRPYLNKVVSPDFEGLASAEFIVLPEVPWLAKRFLQYRLNSYDFVAFASHINEGDRPRVNFGQLSDFQILLPPLPEQRRIVAKIEELFSHLDAGVAALERAQANLERYRASVLKAAVEGRLTEQWRRDNPPREPADALLRRILAERREKWEAEQLRTYEAKGKKPPKGWRDRYKEPQPPDTSGLPALPEGWCWATVEQVTTGDRTSAYGVLQPGPDVKGGIPLIRVSDIDEGRVSIDQLKKISSEIASKYKRTTILGGELLLTIVGTIGRSAIAPETLRGANTARAVAVVPLSALVVAEYVELCFRDPRMQSKLTRTAHEVARKTLNLEDVRSAHFPLAPVQEQVAISAECSRLITGAEYSDAHSVSARKRASRLRQSILKRAFEGKLVPQDPSDEPASVLLERIRAERAANGKRGRKRR